MSGRPHRVQSFVSLEFEPASDEGDEGETVSRYALATPGAPNGALSGAGSDPARGIVK